MSFDLNNPPGFEEEDIPGGGLPELNTLVQAKAGAAGGPYGDVVASEAGAEGGPYGDVVAPEAGAEGDPFGDVIPAEGGLYVGATEGGGGVPDLNMEPNLDDEEMSASGAHATFNDQELK